VQLLDHLATAQQLRLHGHFLDQIAHINAGFAAILGDDLVAGTIETERIAKRDVDIQRQRATDPADFTL